MSRPAVVPGRLRRHPFRGRDAVAAGLLTRRQLDGPAWRRLFTGVYLYRDAWLDHVTWCRAAVLLLPPGGAISGASAAYLYGADVLPLDAPVAVSIPAGRGGTAAHQMLRVTRTRLDLGDVRIRDRMPVTTPVRTAYDLGRGEPDEAVVALDALLHTDLVTTTEISLYAAARRGRPGTRALSGASCRADGRTESPMETRLRLLIVAAGYPAPDVQYRTGGYRLDLAYPELMIGIEYDGDHHRDRASFRRDVARLNALRAAGWTVLRFTADDLRQPERVLATLRRIFSAELSIRRDPARRPGVGRREASEGKTRWPST